VLGLFGLWAAANGGAGLASAAVAGAIAFAVGYGLYVFKVIGAGDAKLFAALALFAGLSHLPLFALATVWTGGLMALVSLAAKPRRAMIMFAMRGQGEHGRGIPYGVAIGVVLWLRDGPAAANRLLLLAIDAAVMVLVALLALSELRQAFSGTVLLSPLGQQEDLLRSILAIAVALGFLGWGARTGQRSWRIGSLVLILLAVIKVFIFDAAGLEGLARIASFLALGLCLIGIG